MTSTPLTARHTRLFRNGRNQALRIPRELELPGAEVVLYREGDRLIIEPVPRKRNRLSEFLATLPPPVRASGNRRPADRVRGDLDLEAGRQNRP